MNDFVYRSFNEFMKRKTGAFSAIMKWEIHDKPFVSLRSPGASGYSPVNKNYRGLYKLPLYHHLINQICPESIRKISQ